MKTKILLSIILLFLSFYTYSQTANAGLDQTVCNTSAFLQATNPTLGTGVWSVISGNGKFSNSLNYSTFVFNLAKGENNFLWTVTEGANSATDDLKVTNNMVADAGSDQLIYITNSVLNAQLPSGAIGLWSVIEGNASVTNINLQNSAVTNLSYGINRLQWAVIYNNCVSTDEVIIQVGLVANAGADLNICENYTTLIANQPVFGTGEWSSSFSEIIFENKSNFMTNVYNLKEGTNTFKWTTVYGGNSATDFANITYLKINAEVAQDTLEVCGTIGYLSGNAPYPGTGIWTLNSGSGIPAPPSLSYTTVSGLAVGVNSFRWTVTLSNCSAYDDMVIMNNLNPATAQIAGLNPICEPEVIVMGNVPCDESIGVWSYSAGYAQFEEPTNNTTLAYNLGHGNNTLAWTVTTGNCSNTSSVDIINNTVIGYAGDDILVCNSSEISALIANDPSPGTGSWSVIGGSVSIANIMNYATTITNSSYGTNTLKWTVYNGGCSDEDFLIVNNNFFTVSAGNDNEICETSVLLNGTNPGAAGTGQWTVNSGGGEFVNSNLYNTIVNGLSYGPNSFTWTVELNGCSANEDVIITNNQPHAFAAGDFITCESEAYLNAIEPETGASGQWTLIGGAGTIVNAADNYAYITGLGQDENTLRWTVYKGACSDTDQLIVTNNTVNQTAGQDQSVCFNYAYLAADPPQNGGTGIWSIGGGHGVFANGNNSNTLVSELNDGINYFIWTVSENGCIGSDEVMITNNRFYVDAGSDQMVNVPNANLAADPGGYVGNGSWSILAGQGVFSQPYSNTTSVSNLQYGYNTYRWYVYNPNTGCSDDDDVNIVYLGLEVDAGEDQHICVDTAYMSATPVNDAVTYWSLVMGSASFDNPYNATTIIRNMLRGENIFRWNVTKNGFTASDDISIYNYQFDTYAGENQHLCENFTQLNAIGMLNEGIPGTWSGEWGLQAGGSGNLSNMNSPTSFLTNLVGLSNGNNFIWTVTRLGITLTNGETCVNKDTVNIRYYDMPITKFEMTPENGKGCSPLNVSFKNTTSALDTISGTEYTWNRLNGGWYETHDYDETFTKTFVNSSYTKDTVYYVQLMSELEIGDDKVCKDSIINPITVYFVPKVEFYANPEEQIYPNTVITIVNHSSENCQYYYWDFGNGDQIFQSSFNGYFAYDGYNTWGDYRISLTVDNGRCVDSSFVDIEIICPNPSRLFDNKVEDCSIYIHEFKVDDVLYTFLDNTGSPEFRWDIHYKNIQGDTSMFAQIFMDDRYDEEFLSFENAGIYSAELYASGYGSNWEMVQVGIDTIIVYDVPVADFEYAPEIVMAEMQPVSFRNYSENGFTYFWDFGDSSEVSNEFEPTHNYSEPGNYFVTLVTKSAEDCVDTKSSEGSINVIEKGFITFPNAIMINGNSENSVFLPVINEDVILEYELLVYDKYGNLIFKTTSPSEGWDGYINGRLAPQDAYIYYCNGVYITGYAFNTKGTFILVE